MIFVELGDITKKNVDAIVCPTNGICSNIRGISRSIASKAGENVELEIKAKYQNDKGKFSIGFCFETSSGKLFKYGIKRIIHSIIVSSPGSLCSAYDVSAALTKMLELAIKNERKSIAIPGLGIEGEGIDEETSAIFMSKVVRNYSDKIEIHIIDRNEIFVEKMKKYIFGNKEKEMEKK